MTYQFKKVIGWFGGTSALMLAGLLATVSLGVGGCEVVRATGQAIGGSVGGTLVGLTDVTESQLIDERQEDGFGQAVAVKVTNAYGYYDDEKLNRYVTLVGLTVVTGSDRPDGKFIFGVVNSEEIGAFSGPGGYIMITRGALREIDNEAELAGVLAHEIGHVCRQHGLEAVKKANLTQGLTRIASAQTDPQYQAAFDASAMAIIDAVGQEFSQEDEFEADAMAVKYLLATNYNASAYVDFLKKLGTDGKQMKTHPASAERIAKVQQLIAEAGKTNQGQTLKARYALNVAR